VPTVPLDAANRSQNDARTLVIKRSGRSASDRALELLNRELSEDWNIQHCGSSRTPDGVLRTCDSVLRCVLCSLYRLAERRADLTAGLRYAPDAALVTLTRSHGVRPLAEEWDTTESILRKFTNRSDWSRFQKRHDITGYSISVETTGSANGWHVHVHALLAFGHRLDPGAVERLTTAVSTRWCNAAALIGHHADRNLQTVEMIRTRSDREQAAEYVTKQHLLHRAPSSRVGRYPADLLAGAKSGDADDIELYREYLNAAFNRDFIRAYGTLSSHFKN